GWRDVDLNAWMGLLGPRAMPEAIVQALNAHFNEILRMPEVQARMATLGIEPVGGAPAVLARQIAQDDQRFGRLVREFG
ncbi:tripartite tricarboxylate transporter substrate-binding protein, partial [Escherichia coli]|uniref:tripartite tricarboxylate transporter substrate-binding protein n=2 Tax=Pseudomonadota TaxID=1224 RepID=UPI0039E11626